MQPKRLVSILCAALMVAGQGVAQSPAPFPDFEAKRLKPPSANAKRRITVQIEERANPAVPAPVAGGTLANLGSSDASGAPTESLYDWFWKDILAQTESTGPGRLQDALDLVTAPSGKEALPPPRLQMMQDISAAYGRDILLATIGTEVSPALVLATIYVESAGNINAISSAGAMGLMQLMPATVERFDVVNPQNAADNIKGGVAFLDVLLKRYNGDPILALAGYNAGEGAVGEHGGVPPYPETMNYIPQVMSAFSVARGLCTTAPLLPSDPCVFAVIAN